MFDITLQLPFEKELINHPGCSQQKVLDLYQAIDWPSFDQELFERQDEVINYFYFFEISRNGNDGKELILIAGNTDQDVDVNFVRPKWVMKGFFKKKEVLDPEYRTNREHVSYTFAQECLQAFLRGNIPFLEQNIV